MPLRLGFCKSAMKDEKRKEPIVGMSDVAISTFCEFQYTSGSFKEVNLKPLNIIRRVKIPLKRRYSWLSEILTDVG